MAYWEERRNQKIFGKQKEEKKAYRIPKKSAKKIRQELLDKESGDDKSMDSFFISMRPKMTGRCLFCGDKTQKDNDENFFFSQAHLFPKSIFKSISTHEEALIELCFYNQSHHTNFDNHMIELSTIKEQYHEAWLEILRKTSILYPVMTQAEKNKVPEILLTALKIKT